MNRNYLYHKNKVVESVGFASTGSGEVGTDRMNNDKRADAGHIVLLVD